MAQAYEYKVVANSSDTTFNAALATEDGNGWEVIGYSAVWPGGGGITWSALLRRRV